MMRIFVSSLIQETNTFSPMKTNISLFQRGYILSGNEIIESLGGTNTEISGFFECLSQENTIQVIPGFCAWAVASGKITMEAFNELCNSIILNLKTSMPVDGVLLALHGAMVSEEIPDCEGYLLSQIRKVIGKDIPISVSLDSHGNLTREMLNNGDFFAGYHTYPHVDFSSTGYRACRALIRMITEGIRPQHYHIKMPIIVPVENAEFSSGINGYVMSQIEKLVDYPEILDVSLFCTQPWLDIPENGISLLGYSMDISAHKSLISKLNSLAAYIWKNKEEYYKSFPSPEKAFSIISELRKPCILVDSGDITTAGGVGDSTEFLRLMMNASVKYKAVVYIVDANASRRAKEVGEGKTTMFELCTGDKGSYNEKVQTEATILKISCTRTTISGESFSGLKISSGIRAALLVNNSTFPPNKGNLNLEKYI